MPKCPCPTKTRYRDRLGALSELARIRTGDSVRGFDVRGAYECVCGSWHLTHKKLPGGGVALRRQQLRGAPSTTGHRFHVLASYGNQEWTLRCVEEPEALLRVRRLEEAREIAGVIGWLAGIPESEVRLKVSIV
jgi:hypothetical protein